jgi:hypothetical protein
LSTNTTAEPGLADFVAQGWERHADHAAEVAAGLQARAATLNADADGAAAMGLAEHVWLSHLRDTAGLHTFLQTLPAAVHEAGATGAMLQRARWLLATLAGEGTAALPDAPRWRALQNLCSLWVARGRTADALAMLQAELPQALAHPEAAARKALAAATHNLAVELREGPRGDAARDTLMLALAEASRTLWAGAGNWVNIERADYELARCHAALGHGPAALRHARACLALIQQHAGEPEADAFETFFAHEALAWAQRAANDAPGLAAERARMQELLGEITDASLKPWCEQALAALDKAG